MSRILRFSWTGICLGMIAVLMKMMLGSQSGWAERVYGGTLFPTIRSVMGWVVSWIPFPALFMVILLVFTILTRIFFYTWKARKNLIWWRNLLNLILKLGGFCGFLIFFFYALWGFNYARPDFKHRMHIQTSFLGDSALIQEFMWIQDSISYYSQQSSVLEARQKQFIWQEDYENEIFDLVKKVLLEFGFPNQGHVPLRKLKPKGLLLCINTAGFYLPFTGEAQFDQGMYGLQWPYTAAHEYFHGFGVTNEGDCNFLAMLVCLRANDPVIKYSGLVAYWRRVASEIYRFDKKLYQDNSKKLPDLFHQDLLEIRSHLDRYPELFPTLRNAVYNQYLKSHGIKEGMRSYNQVVILLHEYRKTANK